MGCDIIVIISSSNSSSSSSSSNRISGSVNNKSVTIK